MAQKVMNYLIDALRVLSIVYINTIFCCSPMAEKSLGIYSTSIPEIVAETIISIMN